MTRTYLTTTYRDKDEVKGLGARWDGQKRKWYVPVGTDLTQFGQWLQASVDIQGLDALPSLLDPVTPESTDLALPAKGIPLSRLLAGVAQAVSLAYRSGVWTTVEVLKVDARRGHVYLELAERDQGGGAIAQARAVIWADTANRIVPIFERATGVVLGGSIKLLVRARPSMHALYGMSLVIDEIDPDYTLGDLEATKREIRARLQREGLFDLNRQLPSPWDYGAVLVVAPQGAAGLGDFQAEAGRLERCGVCAFTYVFSRFQGDGAALEVLQALNQGMDAWRARGDALPDAVVIIRGGGAVNDLAWLNDYGLARALCELEVPVLTGIGHERDSTVLDEVANQRFDTPSKVIGGIEQRIRQRADEAKAAFELITRSSSQRLGVESGLLDRQLADIRAAARQGVSVAKSRIDQGMADVRLRSMGQLQQAAADTLQSMTTIRIRSQQAIAGERTTLDAQIGTVRLDATSVLASANAHIRQSIDTILTVGTHQVQMAMDSSERGISEVGQLATRTITTAQERTEAAMREIAGQGPEKTLSRGFALVRAEDGRPLTRASDIQPRQGIRVQFGDGSVDATASPQPNTASGGTE